MSIENYFDRSTRGSCLICETEQTAIPPNRRVDGKSCQWGIKRISCKGLITLVDTNNRELEACVGIIQSVIRHKPVPAVISSASNRTGLYQYALLHVTVV